MSGLALIGVAGPVVTGALLVFTLVPNRSAGRPMLVVKACISVILGFAIHSLWYLCWLVLAGAGLRLGFWLGELALPLCAYALIRHRRKVSPSSTLMNSAGLPITSSAPRFASRLLFCVFVVVLEATVLILIDRATDLRFGMWDAWAIWNLKAKWFALGGSGWSTVLADPAFVNAHQDYPLLLPLSIARLWLMTGMTSALVPQVFALSTSVIAIALLLMVGWELRGSVTGMVIAASVAIVPQFLMETASQYADVPLSCCYLASLICVAQGIRHNGDWRWLLLAGLLAGAALWTKNEGVLFAVCALLAILTIQRVVGSLRSSLVATGAFVAGVLPFFVVWTGMKFLIPAGNDLMSNQSFSTIWSRGLDVSRHAAILSYAWFLLTHLPDRVGVLLLLFYVFVSRGLRSVEAAALALTLGLTMIGYYIVFLTTPNDLHWQLTTSASRLAIQLWPSLLLTVMLLVENASAPSVASRGSGQ